MKQKTDNEKDFHILPIEDDSLINHAPGLDDEEEFDLDIEDLSELDDMPDSDRAMLTASSKPKKR